MLCHWESGGDQQVSDIDWLARPWSRSYTWHSSTSSTCTHSGNEPPSDVMCVLAHSTWIDSCQTETHRPSDTPFNTITHTHTHSSAQHHHYWPVAIMPCLVITRKPRESECPDVKNYKWQLNPVWHRMLYSCTYMATMGNKGLNRCPRKQTNKSTTFRPKTAMRVMKRATDTAVRYPLQL